MRELWKLVELLESDIRVIAELLLQNQRNGALERGYVRAIFAGLEGILYLFRQEIISSSDFDRIFNKSERALILERKYDRKKDVVKEEPMYLPLKDSIKSTVRFFAIFRGISNHAFPDNSGWQDMLKSIKIRDALMHPKKMSHLELSISGIECVLRAKNWFRNELIGNFF